MWAKEQNGKEWITSVALFLKKSDRAKSDGSNSLLGIKQEKQWATVQNKVNTANFVKRIAHYLREKEWKCDWLSKNEGIFVKDQFALLNRAMRAEKLCNESDSLFKESNFEQKSEEQKSKKVNSQPCIPDRLVFKDTNSKNKKLIQYLVWN